MFINKLKDGTTYKEVHPTHVIYQMETGGLPVDHYIISDYMIFATSGQAATAIHRHAKKEIAKVS
jgi:hypothetical protein